jgi:UDP-GlcNAc3NAcA epimerase
LIHILTVIGARPQFIKAAVVSRVINQNKNVKETIVHTGQHFDINMDKIFFDELNIPSPKYNLNINSLTHGAMTGMMLLNIEKIIMEENPDLVLVYGDTNSTLAGALAAKKLHIKIAHVEAGLRSFNSRMPEEINRILTDRVSDFLFCPTEKAVNNLSNEGFNNFDCRIINCGDVMLDLAMLFKEAIQNRAFPLPELKDKDYIICTLHREENTSDLKAFRSITDALNKISEETKIILPVHPRTKKLLAENEIKLNFNVVEPLGYLDMMKLLSDSKLVMTDSGGLQKEAFFFGRNCVTLREQTEWTELVDNGFNVVAGTEKEDIYNSYSEMIQRKNNFKIDLYGNGRAAEKIVNTLIQD